jgi:glucose/arabinose dehydrogenase
VIVRRAGLVVALLLAVVGLPGAEPAGAATLPSGFTDALVAQVTLPTAFEFHPDGRMFVTTQPGRVRVIQNGVLSPTAALDISASVCSNSERGLLGIAFDPQVATNGFVYLYYTANIHGSCATNTPTAPVNRVSRFTLSGSTIDPASELILIDGIPNPNGNHNAGDLEIGNDGFLYASVGDGGCDYAFDSGCMNANDAARDLNTLNGKIIRITRTGGIPSTNPFSGAGTARCNAGPVTPGTRCQEIFATGLRNPFRMAFDPNTASNVTSFRINDVGGAIWEEINIGMAGADYGWNVREGHCAIGSTTNCGPPPAGMTNPIHDYPHSTGCSAVTGGVFVPNGVWPSQYNGDYLFSDYVCGKIFRLEPNGSGGFIRTDFVTGLGQSSAVFLDFGPFGSTQALYYTTYAQGGQVRRISANVPVASFEATPASGSAPLTVDFDASASAGAAPLTYLWDFGDAATQTTSTPTVEHTYGPGTFTAQLVVRGSDGQTSPPATRTITVTNAGNTAPRARIVSPARDAEFAVGQSVTVQGQAMDAQDGVLTGQRLSWEVLLHHRSETGGDHTHPLHAGTGPSITFAYPAPEDLLSTRRSFVSVTLTATDSQGTTTSVRRVLRPNRVGITLGTQPGRLDVTLATPSDPTVTLISPTTIVSWAGWPLTIGAPSPQNGFTFQRWSDNGAQTHTVVTPAVDTEYRAFFN